MLCSDGREFEQPWVAEICASEEAFELKANKKIVLLFQRL
jgi:hypothetical protein